MTGVLTPVGTSNQARCIKPVIIPIAAILMGQFSQSILAILDCQKPKPGVGIDVTETLTQQSVRAKSVCNLLNKKKTWRRGYINFLYAASSLPKPICQSKRRSVHLEVHNHWIEYLCNQSLQTSHNNLLSWVTLIGAQIKRTKCTCQTYFPANANRVTCRKQNQTQWLTLSILNIWTTTHVNSTRSRSLTHDCVHQLHVG